MIDIHAEIDAAIQQRVDAALAADATLDEVAIAQVRAEAVAQLQAALAADAQAGAAALKAKDDEIAALKARIALLETPPDYVPPAPLPPPPPVEPPPPPPGTFDPLTLNATNTGASGTLTNSGGITTSANGQVIQNKNITGRVTVAHKNVTIKNCKINIVDWYAIIADSTHNDVSGLTVDHCTISGAVNGIAGRGTFTRNDISKCDNGINCWGPCMIVENYIHDLQSPMEPLDHHNDGIENNGADNMTLLRNRIEAKNGPDTSAVMTNNESGTLRNILIEGNYIAGGQYTLYCDNRKVPANAVSNFVVKNNTIKKGVYGHTALYTSGIVIDGSNRLI